MLSIVPVASQLAGAASNVPAVAPTPAVTPALAYAANAFGTTVNVGKVLTSGPTADIALGCTMASGVTRSDTAVGLTLPGVTSGTISNVVSSDSVDGNPTASASSTISGASLAGGIISATAISATAQTTFAGGVFSNAGGATLVGLTIGSQTLAADPPPNTKIAVPGVGSLILNQQTATPTSLTVNAIDLTVTVASTGLGLGTKIVIGHAHSALLGPTTGEMGGIAFGASLTGTGVVALGRVAPAYLPCLGTDGVTDTNTTLGITTPLVSTATISSSDEGDALPAGPQATTSDTIQGVNLLPGVLGSLVSATTVTATASATLANGITTVSETGSQFVGLSVAGFPLINDDVAPNTELSIPGVGTLWLNRVIVSPHGIEVRMIELVLSVSVSGNPAGTDLIISDASARVF
jgi:hypothetical protein